LRAKELCVIFFLVMKERQVRDSFSWQVHGVAHARNEMRIFFRETGQNSDQDGAVSRRALAEPFHAICDSKATICGTTATGQSRQAEFVGGVNFSLAKRHAAHGDRVQHIEIMSVNIAHVALESCKQPRR
jgi:hypothetical protein